MTVGLERGLRAYTYKFSKCFGGGVGFSPAIHHAQYKFVETNEGGNELFCVYIGQGEIANSLLQG